MKKIKSGVKGLDELLDGGLYKKSSTVIAGPPGTGKTTFGVQFLFAATVAIADSNKELYISGIPEPVQKAAVRIGLDAESFLSNA